MFLYCMRGRLMTAPTVACIHIPRFAVEVERQRREDAGARLILIGEGTVFDCSLGADASGVRRGMRMSEAIGLCQRAVVLPPDGPYYKRRFEEVLDLLGELSPVVEGAGLGLAFLSLDGLPMGASALAEELISVLHRRTGFMVSAGIGNGKFTARVAACTTRPGVAKTISPGGESDFLVSLLQA